MHDNRVKLIRNIRTGIKNGNTWLFFESSIMEAGFFTIGSGIELTIDEKREALIFRRSEDTTHIVSKRKRAHWKQARPIMDKTNKEISKIIRAREQVDILVSDGLIIVKHSRSFDLSYIKTPMLGDQQKQIRTLSVPGGAGIGMACLADTGYFSSVGSLDVWGEAIDTYRNNFPGSVSIFSDIRNIHPDYIPECDLVLLTPECIGFSNLGSKKEDVVAALGPHYARIVYASGADFVLMEQVVPYYKTRAYAQLDSLLSIKYPYKCGPFQIDAYDMGSVAGRQRGYCIYSTRPLVGFQIPAIPRIPEHRRPTLNQVLKGFDLLEGDWKPIKGTVMEGLLKKNGNNNFRAEANRTLVTLQSTRLSAFVTSYRKVQVTSSYLSHPEDSQRWRIFEPREIAKILGIPDWFEFNSEITSDATKTKLLGQSMDGNVLKSLGVELATHIMGIQLREKIQYQEPTFVERDGQLHLF